MFLPEADAEAYDDACEDDATELFVDEALAILDIGVNGSAYTESPGDLGVACVSITTL